MFYIGKIWLVNLALALLALFLCLETLHIWFGNTLYMDGTNIQSEMKTISDIPSTETIKMNAEPFYESVVKNNLFAPGRMEIISVIPDPEPEPPPKPEVVPEVIQLKVEDKKIVLYGVIVMDDYQAALVNNFDNKEPEKTQKWVKVDEMIGDLKLEQVNNDRVIFSKAVDGKLEKYAVLLFDTNKPERKEEEIKEVNKPVVISAGPEANKLQEQKTNAEPENSDEYEWVNTPFGKFKRRKSN